MQPASTYLPHNSHISHPICFPNFIYQLLAVFLLHSLRYYSIISLVQPSFILLKDNFYMLFQSLPKSNLYKLSTYIILIKSQIRGQADTKSIQIITTVYI